MNDPQQQQPKKSSGCLKVFLIVAGVVVFCILVVGIMIYQSVSWLSNAPETSATVYPPLTFSEGEQEDIDRVIVSVDQAKRKQTVVEETSITPAVFNGVIQRILDGERAKHPQKKDIPLAIRGDFDSGQMHLKITMPVPPEKAPKGSPKSPLFINGEAWFNIEIVEGEIKQLSIDRILIRGKDAPFLARVFLNHFIDIARQENQRLKKSPENPLSAIKLLKREGDRLHIILDGKRMFEQEERKQPAPNSSDKIELEKKDSPTTF